MLLIFLRMLSVFRTRLYLPEPEGAVDTSACSPELMSKGRSVPVGFCLTIMLTASHKHAVMCRFPSWLQFCSPPCIHALSREALHMDSISRCPNQCLGLWPASPVQCGRMVVCRTQAIYVFVNLTFSCTLIYLVSFLWDNMNHILNIFVTQKSSSSCIFNCSLIPHIQKNKPQ